ncbi:hypothetical protein, partial [Pseudomonas oryzihabitans]|uniref:hypothetical protein n=1 Tax=Pseudomonas oryzihabitans TaxID=47885 RepID=UPI002B1DD180
INVDELGSKNNFDKSERRNEKNRKYNEFDILALSEKERRIEELEEKISEYESDSENREKEILGEFISLLDSKKYGHVIG